MPAFPYADDLVDELVSMAGNIPDTVDVLQLPPPDVGRVRQRLQDLSATIAGIHGLGGGRPEVTAHADRTTVTLPGGLRAAGYHASGSMTVALDPPPGADTFTGGPRGTGAPVDPGDEVLADLLGQAGERLGLPSLVPDGDRLPVERLWRVQAAGEPAGSYRALGAFRHFARDLPVYGRASATIELGASGRPVSLNVSTRRFADDGGGATIATPVVRRPHEAAWDVAARVVESFGGLGELSETRLVPQWFRFGYLSLGPRREQRVLAPFYLASVKIERDLEVSAHVTAVPGSMEHFVRLPPGLHIPAQRRQVA